MLIDSLAIQASAAVAWRSGTAGVPLNNQKDVIEALHGALTSCGWSSIDLFPHGTITYFLGAPSVSGATSPTKRPVGCGPAFVTLGSARYVLYDPGHETPVPGATCTLVPMGTTPEATLANLSAAMTSGVWLASWRNRTGGGYFLDVVCLVAGGAFNYTAFLADGSWGVASEISGGGYTFTSVADSRTAQYTVKVSASGQVNAMTRRSTKPIIFDYQTPYNAFGNAAGVFMLDTSGVIPAPGYQIVANPYGFAVWMAGQSSILSAAPYIPADFQAAYALLVAYPTLTTSLYWRSATVWLDNPPQSYFGGNYPRMLAVRSPGTVALKSPTGAPLITTAWLMLARNDRDTPAVVGRLWDMAVANDQVSSSVIAGQRYAALASQDGGGGGTRCTLLMRAGD